MLPRKLNQNEMQLIDRLLEEDFPGRDAISEQIKLALVEQIDANGSLKFYVNGNVEAVTKFRIPTEGEFEDVDGVTIHVLLHVVDGRVNELEIYKDDSSPVIDMPKPKHLRLFQPNSGWWRKE
jgi:hypothetical protein